MIKTVLALFALAILSTACDEPGGGTSTPVTEEACYAYWEDMCAQLAFQGIHPVSLSTGDELPRQEWTEDERQDDSACTEVLMDGFEWDRGVTVGGCAWSVKDDACYTAISELGSIFDGESHSEQEIDHVMRTCAR